MNLRLFLASQQIRFPMSTCDYFISFRADVLPQLQIELNELQSRSFFFGFLETISTSLIQVQNRKRQRKFDVINSYVE